MHQSIRFLQVAFLLIPVLSHAYEPEYMLKAKVEASSGIQEMKALNYWCVNKYPDLKKISDPLDKIITREKKELDTYVYSKDRSDQWKSNIRYMETLQEKGWKESLKYYEEEYNFEKCTNVISYRVKHGLGEELERQINL